MFVIGSPQSKMGIQMKHEQGWVERSSCIYSTQTPLTKRFSRAHKLSTKTVSKSCHLLGPVPLRIQNLPQIAASSKANTWCHRHRTTPCTDTFETENTPALMRSSKKFLRKLSYWIGNTLFPLHRIWIEKRHVYGGFILVKKDKQIQIYFGKIKK